MSKVVRSHYEVSNKFSRQLVTMLSDTKALSIRRLVNAFGEKSFAILFLLLMAIPSLPLPTGGVTHIFELIVILLSLEMIAGRKTVWLPKRWLDKNLPKGLQTSALPKFTKMLAKIERISRQRIPNLQRNRLYTTIAGVVVAIFALCAFLAPPFSGLDTLPSLGVVFISLAIIFEDTLLSVVGFAVGIVGISLVFLLGNLAFQLF